MKYAFEKLINCGKESKERNQKRKEKEWICSYGEPEGWLEK